MNQEELIVEALASDVHEEDGWLSDAQAARLEWDADNRAVRFHGEGSIDLAHIAEIASTVFEQAHTPTDGEREAIDAEAERLWPTGREYSPRQTAAVFSVKELDAYCASAFSRGARYALGLRRTAQVER